MSNTQSLPARTGPMYTGLGLHWAGLLLVLLRFALVWILFAFLQHAQWIRRKSGISVEWGINPGFTDSESINFVHIIHVRKDGYIC